MSYLRDTAFVLKCAPYREHDVRLTLYGKNHGKLEAVARGAMRPNAKHLGHVEPLAQVQVMIAKGAAIDKVAVVRVENPRVALRERLGILSIAGAFADLVDRLIHPAVSDGRIYDLLAEILDLSDASEAVPSPERGRVVLAAASLKLLDCLGYAPTFADAALPRDVSRLLAFMRERTLHELLCVTAPPALFRQASEQVESAWQHTPLDREPHGPRTVAALLA